MSTSSAPPIPQDPFAPLHEATLRAIAETGVVRTFPKNTVLIHEGDTGDALYIVLSGRVKVYASNAQGREFAIAFHGTGEYVGEMALDGGPRSASVEAAEPTVCAVVTREQLLAHIAAHPDFALELMARLIRRARLATDNARSVALIDVYGRLTRLLDQLADPPDAQGWRTLRERLTHQQIASHLACSREMVSRLLKDLETGGYVATRERRLVLLKPLPARW